MVRLWCSEILYSRIAGQMSHKGTMNATTALAMFRIDCLGKRWMCWSLVFPCSIHQHRGEDVQSSTLLTSLEEIYSQVLVFQHRLGNEMVNTYEFCQTRICLHHCIKQSLQSTAVRIISPYGDVVLITKVSQDPTALGSHQWLIPIDPMLNTLSVPDLCLWKCRNFLEIQDYSI